MAIQDRGFGSMDRIKQQEIGVQAFSELEGMNPLESFLNDLHGGDAQITGNGTYTGRDPGASTRSRRRPTRTA
jgi:hypothetical protein